MKTLIVPGSRPLGAPKGWDQELDGECGVLFVVDHVDTLSGQNFQYSFYRPTQEEIDQLMVGGALRLGIMGTSHPVLNMAVFSAELTQDLNAKEGFDMGPIIERQ